MVEFKGALAKLVKKTEFEVLNVEDESSEQNNVLRIEIAEKIKVTGSNPLPNGAPMVHAEAVIWVAGNDVETFMSGVTEKDGKTFYSGDLKLDVSKPKTKMENGAAVITKPARLWLTAVKFNKRGNELRSESRDAGKNAILKLFGQAVVDAIATPSRTSVAAQALEVTAEEEPTGK